MLKDLYFISYRTKDDHMSTVSSDAAARIADEVLSSNDHILLISIRDQTGKILAVKFRESFGKTFRLSELVDNNLGGTLAVAVLGVVNEVREVFGRAEAKSLFIEAVN